MTVLANTRHMTKPNDEILLPNFNVINESILAPIFRRVTGRSPTAPEATMVLEPGEYPQGFQK